MLSNKYLENLYCIFAQEVLQLFDCNNLTDDEQKFLQGVVNDVRKNYNSLKTNLDSIQALINCKQ